MILKRLIILGSSSFVGRSIPAFFSECFEETIGVGSEDCDLTNLSKLNTFGKEYFSESIILYLSTINKFVENNKSSYVRNVSMAANLCEVFCKYKPAGVIYTSSVDVYGPHPSLPVTVYSPTNPDDYYSKSKLACEKLLLDSIFDFPIGIFRCPGIYNLRDFDQSVVSKIYVNAIKNKKVVLFNNGNSIRNFIHTDDLYRMFLNWIRNRRNGTWNAVSKNSITMRKLVEILIEHLPESCVTLELNPEKSKRDFDLVYDMDVQGLMYLGVREIADSLRESFVKNIETCPNEDD